MAIQMRRGQEVNFDADKMLPGEWAVSLDTRYVRMCFAPGVCVRMATYDAFEVDMAKIEAILAECQTIEEVVTRVNTEVSANAQAVAEYTSQAKQYRDEAEEFRNQAEEIVGFGKATKEDLGIIRGGDNYIDEDGTLVLTRTTTERELIESQNGGIRIISMDGESQQKQYSGKNLYDEVANNIEVNHSGIKFTKNEYGNLTLSGTTTASINAVMNPFTLPAGTYYYQKGTVKNVSVRLYNRTTSAFIAYDNGSFTLAEESTLDVRVQSNSGSAISGTIKIQIEKGSTMTEYEPYVGGIASPNPEYEQDVDSVEVSEIWTHGRNLEYNSATYEGWNVWNWDGTITGETYNGGKVIKYTKDWQFRYPPSRNFKAGTYTISFDARVKTSGNAHVYSSGLGVSKSIWITASNNFSRHSFTFTLTEDKRGWITVIIQTGSTVEELYIANIQVEEGSETEYEPYTETREELSETIILRGIGDTKDVLCKQNGVFGVLREYKPFTLDGTQEISRVAQANDATTYRFAILDNIVKANAKKPNQNEEAELLANSLTVKSFESIYRSVDGICIYTTGSFNLYHDKFKKYTVEELNGWLSENPINGIYRLATPTFEPLPLADQIALHKLESFGGVTYLFTDSTIEPIIEVEYGTSKVGGYAIKGLNTADANALMIEQLKTLTNELATQIVAGSEA